jgi:hypothetical protein
VIEATTMCLVSYVQDVVSHAPIIPSTYHSFQETRAEDDQPSVEEIERALLQEFSRCIGQIVESAKDAKANRTVRQ